MHRSGTLTRADVTRYEGIPITTPARTIIDLAHRLNPRDLEYIVDLADQRGLIDFDDLRQAKPASLKAVLQAYDPPKTRSEHERRFFSYATPTASHNPRATRSSKASRSTSSGATRA